ncbi:hypothetical protein [Sphingobacterium griseoflavum]|uniref:hypothetical protein n=1 Tax=Sphingobacterium griseoflavum TaxID=1474952 RepID=UPI001673E1FC|nr:hypothetical protein [Sphingobacterium griseoflavum]
MESFLPVLLIIAGVMYKIYSEYQKEQEKARRRQPQVPPIPPTTAEPVTKMRKAKSIPPPIRKQMPSRSRVVVEEMVPSEVQQLREKKKVMKEHSKAIPAPKLEVLPEHSLDFDLRQAVIQSAILERPYRD